VGLKKPTEIEIDENGFQFNRATDDESFAIISWASKNLPNPQIRCFSGCSAPPTEGVAGR
jgi:hypothetical protein